MLVPKLRFKREDGTNYPDWEKTTFEEYYKIFSGNAFKLCDYVTNGIPIINGEAIQHGFINGNNLNYLPNQFLVEYSEYALKEGDIVLGLNRPITNGKLKIAIIPAKYNDSLLYQRAGKILFVSEIDKYFSYIYLSNEILRFTLKEAVGSDQPFISTTKLGKWNIHIPKSNQEIEKIGVFFKTLDEVIAQSEAEVRNLEQQKKAAMQKIFSQEIRFKREDRTSYPEWNGKSFSNTFSQLNNNTFSRDMLSENGTVCNIHYGDVLVKFGEVCNIQTTDIPKVNADIDTSKFDELQDGDIILADTAEDEIVGKATEIYCIGTSKVISGLHTMACRPNEKYAPKYLGYYINSPTYHNQLIPFMQGIKVTSIGRKNIADTVIYYPTDIEEQQKIADFLSAYDEAITYAKQELDKWKELKKGLLQQMFV